MQRRKSANVSAITRSIVLLAALMVPQLTPQVAHAQWQWRATVGAQNKDLGRQVQAFLPNELWIHEGDTIKWMFETDEIHTVTFLKSGQTRPAFAAGCPALPPFSSSPASFDGSTCVTTPPLVKGQTFTVGFPKKGNFMLVCLVHPNMTATIHVLDPLLPLPHDQNFYDDQAADRRRDLLEDRDHDEKPDHGHHHNDSTHIVTAGTGEVEATAGGSDTLSVMRFNDSSMTIRAGQTIEWENRDPVTPHTITFGTEPAGNPAPPSANVTVDPDGARHATLTSPAVSAHSGFIVAPPQERTGLPQAPLGVTRFRVTFPNPGVYPYICALHDELGMKGTVKVVP